MNAATWIRWRANLAREWWCGHTRGGHDWDRNGERTPRTGIFAFRFWECTRCHKTEVRFVRHGDMS